MSHQLLTLPREIRDQILGEVLFPGELEPEKLDQDSYGLATTAQRQIWPYVPGTAKRGKFETAVFRTCRQLQSEGEAILYGTSSFNLMYDDWTIHTPKLSYQFFEQLPRRLRRLVQRVERKCYSEPYEETISLFEWNAFMRFLAEECPSLHSLKLWGPGDTDEGPPWVLTCTQDHKWVQAILQIKTMKYFDIPVIQGGNIYTFPAFRDVFMPWLRKTVTNQRPKPEHKVEGDKIFPFLQLPLELRDMIYRAAVLPADKRIYIDMMAWFNKPMQIARSLMLTNRLIHREVSTLLSNECIFHANKPPTARGPINRFYNVTRGRNGHLHLGQDYPPRSRAASLLTHTTLRIRHLDFYHKLKELLPFPNDMLVQARPQLESLTIRLEDQRVFDAMRFFDFILGMDPSQQPYLGPVGRDRTLAALSDVPRRQWPLGVLTPGFLHIFPRALQRFIARIPKVTFRHEEPPQAIIEEDFAIWLSRGLREEFLRGSSEIPYLDWLYGEWEPLSDQERDGELEWSDEDEVHDDYEDFFEEEEEEDIENDVGDSEHEEDEDEDVNEEEQDQEMSQA